MSRPSDGAAPAVEMVGITKRFGDVLANEGVRLAVAESSVHAIVGENGAGKSTLMRMLAGVLRPDEGTIRIRGTEVARLDARAAIRLGIGMVHQHFMLVEPLTVAENLVLGAEPRRRGLVDLDAAARAVESLAATFGLPVDANATVRDLSVGERQRVEILKVLFRGAEILVLDEPTAVLTPPEVGTLFAMLRRLVAGGRTVVLVTHKLGEVMDAADRVTVMRRGKVVAERAVRETSAAELAHLMVGRAVPAVGPTSRRAAEASDRPVALALEGLSVGAGPVRALESVSLSVHEGEILGIAGVLGNGQSELLEAVAGLTPVTAGQVRLGGEDVTRRSVAARQAAGLAHVPEDRHTRGLVLDMTVAENAVLGRQREFVRRLGRVLRLGLDRPRITAQAEAVATRFDVRPADTQLPVRVLSGGNQQKVVLGRELTRSPRVLLAGQPTRGVDVGAVEAIHGELRRARDAGTAVLLVSSDLDELLALSDRIAVLYRGRIVDVLPVAEATPERLGERMMGLAPGETA